ncbi:MAG: motility associated factor glycosyltransferase family protein [Campylobacterales bacterium]|nr:motility associated factor glycosyltransferase family protein [Campylobacterales bacterium]
MINFYEKNLEALVNKDPALAASLFAIKTNEKFEVFQGKDLIDINILDNESGEFVYEKPLKEVSDKLDDFHNRYARYPILFMYGIGNGILSKALLHNNSLEHLVIVEPSLEMIYIALNFIDIADEIASQRIIIRLSESMDFANTLKIIEMHHAKPYARIYNLHIQSEYYEKHYLEDISEKNILFLKCYKHMVIGVGNDSIDALIGIENHVANMYQMLRGYKTSDLLSQKVSDLAVIVSTGPSLLKQLPLLKEYAPYITIISVDASLPILQKHGIVPDIVTSIERVIESAIFFQNLDKELLKDTYFFVSSLTHPYTAYKLKDEKLVLSMRPLSYMKYYEINEFGYMGAGMSASNMAYEIAVHMGHPDIVLIGQDLAYSDDGVSHAEGHHYIKYNPKAKQSDSMIEKYGGGGVVKTTIQWDMFKNFFEKDIADATRWLKINTYNSTEGGARIHGSIEEPFKDVLEKLADTTKEKSKIDIQKVSEEESQELIAKADEKTQVMYDFGLEIKKEVEELFLRLAKTNEEIEKQELEEVDYDNLLKLIEEIDGIKGKVESSEFSKMYIDTVQSFIFHQELNLAKLMVEVSDTDEEKKKKLIKWAEVHEFWLFSLAGGIDSQLYAIDKGRRGLEERLVEFEFLDSLNRPIDVQKIKNLYTKDCVGFLAYEDNLRDEDFTKYIKELHRRYPHIKFKAFYFNDYQKEMLEDKFKNQLDRIELVIPKDLYHLVKEIEVYVWSTLTYSSVDAKIARLIVANSENVLPNYNFFTGDFYIPQYFTVKDFDMKLKNHQLFKEKWRFTDEEFEKYGDSYTKLMYQTALDKIPSLNYTIDSNMNALEFLCFKNIDIALKFPEYKSIFYHRNKNEKR